MDTRKPWTWAILVIGWVASGLYVWTTLDQGWIPHDEGALTHPAERVLLGELPHRDFVDVYTGAQAMLHAAALRIGDDLMATRIVLLGAFLIWLPVFYWIARQFAGFWTALAATALAVGVGPSLYPVAMPSWYNLYLATFGLAAILRWWSSGAGVWLILAGLAAGVSVLFKISGLYFLAACALAVTIHEIVRPGPAARGTAFATLVTLGAVALSIVVSMMVVPWTGAAGFIHFGLPIVAVCAALTAWVWSARRGPDDGSVVPFLGRAGLVVLGFAVPIAAFVVPYATSGALGSLVEGLFVLPALRLEGAAMPPPELITMVFLPPLVITFLIAEFSPAPRMVIAPVLVGLLGVFLAVSGSWWGYLSSWMPLQHLTIFSVVGGCVLMALTPRRDTGLDRDDASDPTARGRVLAVLAVAALCALIQYPYAAPIYAAYVIPLSTLGLLAVLSLVRRRTGTGLVAVMPYLAVFLALRAHGLTVRDLGFRPAKEDFPVRLEVERGGIFVTEQEKLEYENAVAILQERSHGEYILSIPDTPEIYFLADRLNPSRHMYQFFDEKSLEADELLELIRRHDITAMLINEEPDFSEPLSPATREALAAVMPDSASFGRFTVRWAP